MKQKDEIIKAPFVKENYIIMGIALLFIVVGYIFLGIGDITISPILLTLGYCVLFPIGIIYKRRGKKKK